VVVRRRATRRTRRPRRRFDAAAVFHGVWQQLGHAPLVAEHRFAPPRRWRFDAAHLDTRTAVEIEGGTYSAGRHVRAAGYAADCEKYNAAAELDWCVLRYTTQQLKADAAGVVDQVARVIAARKAAHGKAVDASQVSSDDALPLRCHREVARVGIRP